MPAPARAPCLRRALLVLWLPLLAAGCSNSDPPFFQGYVEGEFVYMAAAQSGRLQTLAVTRGQAVQAGALLFSLEAEPQAATRREAQARLHAAEAQLQDIRTGKRPQEIDVTRAQLAQAETEAGRSAAQWARDQQQYQAGGIARAQLDDSRAQARSNAVACANCAHSWKLPICPTATNNCAHRRPRSRRHAPCWRRPIGR